MASVAPVAPMAPMASTTATLDNEWNESKILTSLDQLQNMHVQLRQVRGTIPQLVEPLLLPFASPEDLYLRYSQNALNTGKEIRVLADLMGSPASQAIFKKAKESQATEPDGITSWMVNEHADWLEVRKVDIESDSPAQGLELRDGKDPMDTAGHNPSFVIERFKTQHPGIEIKLKEGASNIIEMTLPPPIPIHFQIDLVSSTPTVTCTEKTNIHLGIIRAIAARPNDASLEYLLEMLCAFDDLKSRPCLKCNRVLDRSGQFPIQRTGKRTGNAEHSHSIQWQAFHESCG